MKIKDQTIQELDLLNPEELLIIHDMIQTLKKNRQEKETKRGVFASKVREILKPCSGSLSDDISKGREERL